MKAEPRLRPAVILLVEDSPTDKLLACEALAAARISNDVHHADDGVEAMAFLRRMPPHEEAPRPDLVLLDLNLPRMDGREVLRAMKSDAALKAIPVVVLTTSSDETDIARAYSEHANCYVVKPLSFERFIGVIRQLEEFWLVVAKLPAAERGDHPGDP